MVEAIDAGVDGPDGGITTRMRHGGLIRPFAGGITMRIRCEEPGEWPAFGKDTQHCIIKAEMVLHGLTEGPRLCGAGHIR